MIKNNVIFIDCFDTVICRKLSASEVILKWAEEINKKYPSLSTYDFYKIFKSSENYLSKKHKKEINEAEYTLLQILKEMSRRIIIFNYINDFKQDEFIEFCIKSYVETEKKYQYVNPRFLKKIQKFKKEHYKIYIVSDFYCGKDILKIWFKALNIESLFNKIYVSCDYMLSKRTGELYKYIIKELNINYNQSLMIGDDKHSDYIVPKRLGIKTNKVSARKIKFSLEDNFNLEVSRKYKNIFSKKNCLNYSNYSFPLFYFTHKLATELKNKNLSHVYFLSREGQFLKKIFDKYNEVFNIEITSDYLEVSRNSVLVASLKNLNVETFNNVFYNKVELSVYDFLKTLEFTTEEINAIRIDFTYDINTKIHNFKDSKCFKDLKSNSNFIKLYDIKRATQYKNFKEYLKTFDKNIENDIISIVDVGWRGTMQDCLFEFFDGKVKIEGYYIGYNGEGVVEKNNRKYGLLYSDYPFEPSQCEKIYNYKSINYEQVLRADHNRVIGYDMINGEIKCLYDTMSEDIEIFQENIKPLQTQIYEKFIDICNVFDLSENINDICHKLYLKMIFRTNVKDLKWLYSCLSRHNDSFVRIGKSKDIGSFATWALRYKLSILKFKLKLLLKRI